MNESATLTAENEEAKDTIRTLRKGQVALAHDALEAANNAQVKINTLTADNAALRAKNEALVQANDTLIMRKGILRSKLQGVAPLYSAPWEGDDDG